MCLITTGIPNSHRNILSSRESRTAVAGFVTNDDSVVIGFGVDLFPEVSPKKRSGKSGKEVGSCHGMVSQNYRCHKKANG